VTSLRKTSALLACILAFGLAPGTARAEESAAYEAGFGALSAFCSLIYAPVKVVYALGGVIVGGFAWALSAGDNDVASAVITPAVRGDYVITPDMLRGEKPIEFIGRNPDDVRGDAEYL